MNPTNYSRLSGESLIDWKLRLFNNKELYNLTSQQIADIINKETDQNMNESTYRKWHKIFKSGIEYALQNNTSNEILNEYELKKIELESERKKLQSIKIEYNKLIRDNSRQELMFEMVKESIEKLPVPKLNPLLYPSSDGYSGVLAFGDIHFGKMFKSINNEYSPEMAKQRMEQLLTEVVDVVSTYKLEHIDIINGADSIEGMSLRISQLQSLSMGFIDQTIQFSKLISAWLNELSKYVKVTYHHIPASNHSQIRPFNSSRNEFVSEDLEKIIMNYVHDSLANNERIEVPLYDTDIVKLNVQGYNVWALHGHQLKGTKDAIRDLSNLHREFIDFLYVAHFHNAGLLTSGEAKSNNVQLIQIPSVMGSDEYSDSLMTGAKAGATFDIYEKGKGRKIVHNIILN